MTTRSLSVSLAGWTTVVLSCAIAVPAFAADDIVFLAGGRSHGPGEHEFNAGCQILAKALNEQSGLGIKASVVSGWPQDDKILDGIKALVIYADGTSVVGKGWAKVDALAKQGVGIMFMHYAVHPSKEDGEKYYRPWIGGAFEDGWSVNPHWVADLTALPNHPVARGVTGLVQAYDEFYYNMRFPADRSKVLDLVTAMPTRERMKKYINLWNEHGVAGLDKKQTVMWGIERADGGRGVGFTGGHYHRNWAIDGFRTLALNAIVWTAKIEVPTDGVKSKPLSEDDLNANLDKKGDNPPRLKIPQTGEFNAIPTAPVQTDREAKFPAADGKPKASAPAPANPPGKTPAAAAKPVFESPVLTSATKPRLVEIDVALTNAKELYLAVSDEGDLSCDWADWIEPRLVMADGSTKDLTSLKWKSAVTGYGEARVNKSNDNGPLKVDGKTYEQGIGTHAASLIAYDLPAGVVRFTAKVAIDDGGMERGGQPSNASMRFRVYTQAPKQDAVASGITFVPPEIFTTQDELEVTLWATSPLLHNPTNIDFDAQGRMYVAEGVNYRGKGGRQKAGDRIVVLEDTDGDGVADKTSVFVQEPHLAAPLGVAVLGDQIVVSQPPDLLVYTDVDRNGVFDPAVDKRDVLLTGFAGRQHDHSLHSVTAGPDGQWYFNHGNCGAKFTDKSGKTFRIGSDYMMQEVAGQKSDDGNVWIGGATVRMNPDGTNAVIIGHNFRNSYEQTINSFGDLYQSDNDDPPACRVGPIMEGGNAGFSSVDGKRSWGADRRPGQDTPTAHWRQEDPGTMPPGDVYGGGSPTGVAFYENGALPEKWRGLLLACEAGKNVVFGYLPTPDGAGFKLERMDFLTSNKEKEWAGSDFLGGKATGDLKTMFRPSDVCVGPDGAIYVADWFDPGVGGHGTRDDGISGSIYRIAPKGFKSQVPKFDLATTDGQITALKNPSPNVRNLGFTRLKAQGAKAVPAVAMLLKDANPYLAARAAWLLAQMGDSGIAAVTPWLKSTDAGQRLVAYRALRRAEHNVLAMAAAMASDASSAVRREVALTLRDVPAAQSVAILAIIGKQYDGKDRSYLEAFGLGCTGKEAQVYAELAKSMGGPAESWSDAFAGIAWRLHPAEAVTDLKARALASGLTNDQRKHALTALAFAPGRSAAGAMLELAHAKDFSLKDLAKWWLMNRKGNNWKEYDIDGSLKALGLYDPEKVKLVAVEMPPELKDAPALPPAAEIAKLTGDATRGQASAAICSTCHRIGKTGIDYGPDLTSFGKQQTTETIIHAILEPSATISHGFEGSVVKTTDGLTITGLVLSNSDPLIIKCMGGLVQTVPQSRIASVTKMTRSLMYQPQMMGLTPQGVADIVAYLKSL
ncbi:MAG: NPCBM/NEW2 domain-containing protein [Planctomycetes bacterium]|nr:NPCBM/NEW2 domain-containing protein [Planctomycetota bacterium]